jgi:hypothetical protein
VCVCMVYPTIQCVMNIKPIEMKGNKMRISAP